MIPVEARIGEVTFGTSLFPKDGGYLLPLKDAVRRPSGVGEGDDVAWPWPWRVIPCAL